MRMSRNLAAVLRSAERVRRQTAKARGRIASQEQTVQAKAGANAARERRKIEQRIERHLDAAASLIAGLDARDGDPDLEPSLGAPEWGHGGSNWESSDRALPMDDRENDGDDLEPSLGYLHGCRRGSEDLEEGNVEPETVFRREDDERRYG